MAVKEVVYVSTGAYNPKAEKNIKSYQEVLAVLPATMGEIKAAVPQHTDFAGYLIRRGGLAEQGAEPAKAPAKARRKAPAKAKGNEEIPFTE